MDSVFGIGLPEIILILVIAGMVMGPQRIAVAARWFGKTTSQLQAISRSFMRQLNAELSAADSDGQLRDTYNELQVLREQINELRQEVTTVTRGTLEESKQAIEATRAEAQNMIMPPDMQSAREPEPKSVRPPSLSPSPTNGRSNGVSPAPPNLPSRVDVPEDPE